MSTFISETISLFGFVFRMGVTAAIFYAFGFIGLPLLLAAIGWLA